MTPSTASWYFSRSSGVVALLLLSTVVVLGILTNQRGRLPGLPRFAVTGLHRNASLIAVVFLATHILTAVLDGYVSIPLAAAVVPFTSHYEPLWLGFGAVALDLMIVLIVTSLVREHLGQRVWRALHWLTYPAWLVAVVHSFGAAADLRSGWLLAVAAGCVAVTFLAIVVRVVRSASAPARWDRAPAALAVPTSDLRHLPRDAPSRPATASRKSQHVPH